MATTKRKTKQSVLAELISKREQNISVAVQWPVWDIEEQLKRANQARDSFLENDPNYDVRIFNEHIYQLEEALKLRGRESLPPVSEEGRPFEFSSDH